MGVATPQVQHMDRSPVAEYHFVIEIFRKVYQQRSYKSLWIAMTDLLSRFLGATDLVTENSRDECNFESSPPMSHCSFQCPSGIKFWTSPLSDIHRRRCERN